MLMAMLPGPRTAYMYGCMCSYNLEIVVRSYRGTVVRVQQCVQLACAAYAPRPAIVRIGRGGLFSRLRAAIATPWAAAYSQ
jgi:hypothetical protein